LKETELKQEVGTVPYSDVLNFKIRARSAENAMLVAERAYALSTYALAVLMGYPDGKIPEWIEFDEIKVDVDAVLPNIEVYLDAALANRPDLRAMRENLNVRKYNKYSAYSAFSPTISAYANFNVSSSNTRSYNSNVKYSHSTTPSFGYGLNANWTIFNGLVRFNKVREAQAMEAIAKFNVVSSWLTVIQEVRDSYTNYIFSVNQAKLYEQVLVYSTEQRDLVAKEYEAGTIGITRLNEVQNDLINAESTLVSAYLNIKNAKVQLDTAAGLITKEYYLDTESDVPQAENTNIEVQPGKEIVVKTNQSAFIKDLNDIAEEEAEVTTKDGKVVVPEVK
jgi:outer membrane protein TolC